MIALQMNGNQQSFTDDPNMPLSWHPTATKLRGSMPLCGASKEMRQS